MTPNLTRYVNRTILVSIPSLFEDGVCRPYKLLGAELNGVWLESEELTGRLLPDDAGDIARAPTAIFVPLAQIAGIVVATGLPESPGGGGEPPVPEYKPDEQPSYGTETNLRKATKGQPKRSSKKR